MAPPLVRLGPPPGEISDHARWLGADRLARLRAILFAITLFFGLVVWVFHSLGPTTARPAQFVYKLRGVGIMTWLYALVQLVDMRFYHSRFAQRRRATMRIPEIVYGWLFGQMLAWFGILYYGLTEDPRWYVAGLVCFGLSFVAFPIPRETRT